MTVYVYLHCSYSMMTDCWNGDKEARPTFQEIKLKIDGLISDEEGDNYITPGSIVVEIERTETAC